MNYRKRIRVLPGFYLNLSKSGLSATLGVKGFSINLNKNGNYLNTGIPGTGLYSRIKLSDSSLDYDNKNKSEKNYYISDIKEICSNNADKLTTTNMETVKQAIIDASAIKKNLYDQFLAARTIKIKKLIAYIISLILIYGIIKNQK